MNRPKKRPRKIMHHPSLTEGTVNNVACQDTILLPATKERKTVFFSYKHALKNGWRSKSAWSNEQRHVADDADWGIVVRKTAQVGGIGIHPILEDLGNDRYLVADDFYLVFHESQTVEKQQKRTGTKPVKTRLKTSLYIPSNFDPASISDKNRDFACWLLHKLHIKYEQWQADEDGWINLKREYLEKVIPKRQMTAVREELKDRGGIECDHLAIDGEKCFSYRVRPEHWTTHRRIFSTNQQLCRNLEKLDHTKTRLPVHHHLKDQFQFLDFDYSLALRTIPRLTPKVNKRRKGKQQPFEEFHRLLMGQCRKFVDQHFFLEPDDFGRVHTPITSLPKALRPCLLVDGEQLVNIDLANSQPLILAICAIPFIASRKAKYRLLRKEFVGRYADLRQMEEQVEKLFSCPTNSSLISTNSSSLPSFPSGAANTMNKKPQSIGREEDNETQERDIWHDRTDLDRYRRLCESGRFYESLMKPDDDRDMIKEKVYEHILFGKNSRKSSFKDRFAAEFPSVAKMLFELRKKDHCFSAHLMQHYESSLFIHRIARRIMNEHPDVVFFTIHDSILTKKENVAYVKSVIQDEFGKLGISPTLKDEDYGEETTSVAANYVNTNYRSDGTPTLAC